jgi:hypothetical protein
MAILETLDGYGKPAWFALMIVSFMVFWPLGLFILLYMIGSGRMGCWNKGKVAAYSANGFGFGSRCSGPGRWYRAGKMATSSGNRAFDEYREATLKRLEEEQAEFHGFLDKLRQARDKAEFDQFMADRARQADVSDVESGDDSDKPAV